LLLGIGGFRKERSRNFARRLKPVKVLVAGQNIAGPKRCAPTARCKVGGASPSAYRMTERGTVLVVLAALHPDRVPRGVIAPLFSL